MMDKQPGRIYWANPQARIAGAGKIRVPGTAAGGRRVPEAGRSADKKTVKPEAAATLASVLQQTARKMAPFYRKVADSAPYARKWSEAVVELDLDGMERLLKIASPRIGRNYPATNGIGYFISFPFPDPVKSYSSGTTIPPGTVQSVFEPEAHRALAEAVYPLYRSLSLSRSFAQAVAAAVEGDDPEAAAALVRAKVKSKSLRTVGIESGGVALSFRFSFSKYTYRNLLIRDETA
ncbi:MAG: hypothetical protein K0R57_4546 [Paenibacillaceae bacterium]|nr:hypothetical protein [Paenibacillaceae bacterium]